MRILTIVIAACALLAPTPAADDLQCAVAALLSQPPSATDLPLCGNGVLDRGEVCDDGNRIGGDGCNAWCSQFDLMTRACTVAGTGASCASSPVLDAPALTTFCSLTALAVSADSSYAILADGGALLRMPLFVAPTAPITQLRATVDLGPFTRFCSVHALPDGSTLAYECALRQVLLFSPDGTNVRVLAALADIAAAAGGRAWYDPAAGELLVAGVPAVATPATCARLYAVSAVSGGARLAGSVPCEVYNVWEGGTIYTSFSVQGMVPYEVAIGPCLLQMASARCYIVRMVRDDMQTMQAYVPSAGGDDLHYSVSTDPTVNVLGTPAQAVSADGAVAYTATGGCFAAQALSPAAGGKVAPRVALGAACAVASVYNCWTPLNSPFNTDVLSSPYTIPAGLSARHTHEQLVAIFSVSAASIAQQLGAASGVLLSGMPLYRQILNNAYAGTAPVAFAEIPATRDVLYITAGTVGLISTKGIVVNDIYNPGYCMATAAIQCPQGFFGSVGGACRDCATQADGSPAAQVQCLAAVGGAGGRRRLMSAGQSPPTVQMSAVVTQAVGQDIIDTALAYYLMAKSFPCHAAGSTTITPHQPFNMDADALDSGAPTQNLTSLLVQAASDATGVDHAFSAEYSVQWTAQSLDMLAVASSAPGVPRAVADADFAPCASIKPVPNGLAANITAACAGILNRRLDRNMMQCLTGAVAAFVVGAQPSGGGGRRLMQQASSSSSSTVAYIAPTSMFTFVANTPIDFSLPAPTPPSAAPATPTPSSSGQGVATWTIIAGALGGAAGLVVITSVLYCGFMRHAVDSHVVAGKMA